MSTIGTWRYRRYAAKSPQAHKEATELHMATKTMNETSATLRPVQRGRGDLFRHPSVTAVYYRHSIGK